MAEVHRTAVIRDALRRLGFVSYVGPEGHTVDRHEPSDTFFLFHRDGPDTLPPLRLESIRRLSVGRGATTERAFDNALAEATMAAAEVVGAAPRRRKRTATVA